MRVLISMILGMVLTLVIGLTSSTQSISTAKPHQVIISGFEFVPKEITVSAGDKITWINKDIVPHNIATSSGQNLLSPDLASGESFSLVVNDSLSYICGLHPSMQGKLTVKQ